MDIESELAELDKKEFQRLKRIITKNKGRFNRLNEKQKIRLLTGWITDIKEEKNKKAEDMIEHSIDEETISAEEEKTPVDLDESYEKTPEIEVVEDGAVEKKKGGWFKFIIAIFIILLIVAACVIGTLYLLKDKGNLKFSNIHDKVINENEQLKIRFITKNADGIDIYNMPDGSRFDNTTFVWTPTYVQAGIYNITTIAYNNQSNKTQTFRIKVNNVNRIPKIVYTSPPKDISVQAGKKVHFKVIADDKDKDILTYVWYFGSEKYNVMNEVNRTFTVPGDKKVKVVVCDSYDCVSYAWYVKVVSPAYITIAPKTYVVTEIAMKNDTIAKENNSEGTMSTYTVSKSGSEEVVVIPNAESNENIINKYVLEG